MHSVSTLAYCSLYVLHKTDVEAENLQVLPTYQVLASIKVYMIIPDIHSGSQGFFLTQNGREETREQGGFILYHGAL